MLVLGGSQQHRGGLEAFCERTTLAINDLASGWRATWWTTDTAFLNPRQIAALIRTWRKLGTLDAGTVDLVWLQWATVTDLLLLRRVMALGLPVMVTPHMGANARLQRVPWLRALCVRLLAPADRLALLFETQGSDIALPPAVPRSKLGTFLPSEALAEPVAGRSGETLRLLHAGRLSREKGSFRLIAICAILRERGIPFHAEIVGSASPEVLAELRAEIAAQELTDHVQLLGWMNGPELRQALARADVLVHLSELDSFPLIVMEALAAGALPLVSDMAGAASMVQRYDGLVTPRGDVAAAAEWLVTNDPAGLRLRGGIAAQAVRADHAWSDVVARLEQIADETIDDVGSRKR
jgi:glycosyltransferase involved in cell wall biosynthesis